MNNEFLIDRFIRSLILWGTDDTDDIQDDFINAFFSYYVTRADFRIDFWSKNKSFYDDLIHPYDLLKNKMVWRSEFYKEDGVTCSSKNVWKKENKYIYVRFYDKKQEILDDNTQFLYTDYHNYEWNIWRLEFQFMSRFTTARWRFNFWDIFVGDSSLTSQIFEYLWLDVKKGAFSVFYKPEDIPFDKLPLWKKKSIATRLKNTLKYLHLNWVNSLALIDAIYMLDGDQKWLETFHNDIIHYIDKKDDIVPKLYKLIKDNLSDNIDIIEK